MTDWKRKHMETIAWVARECSRDETLRPAQKDLFDEVATLARRLSNYPRIADEAIKGTVVSLCNACRDSLSHPCDSREDWRQPCCLISARLYS